VYVTCSLGPSWLVFILGLDRKAVGAEDVERIVDEWAIIRGVAMLEIGSHGEVCDAEPVSVQEDVDLLGVDKEGDRFTDDAESVRRQTLGGAT
jgi:hypothetical protein